MCTVTLRNDAAGLLLTMNRDEARDRAPELPPRVAPCPGGGAWLGPRDGARGGSWMGVNARGLAACLLNRYQDSAGVDPAAPSRGTLVPAALAHPDCAAARDWAMHSLDVASYAPFTLILADRAQQCAIAWDGRHRAVSALPAPWAMVTSSLFEPEQVAAWRQNAFAAWLESGAPLAGPVPAFHLLQPPGQAFYAPLMDRAVSCTRSITQVEIAAGAGLARLRYAPVEGSPPAELAAYALPLDAAGGTP
jgi:hypothetical protein